MCTDMILIKQLTNNSVIFAETDQLTLDNQGTHGRGWISRQFTTENAVLEVYEGELPAGFLGNCWAYNGKWTVLKGCEDRVETEKAEHITAAKDEKVKEINDLRKTHLYSDVTVDFPSGSNVIQFRDDSDRMNLSDVSAGAMSLIVSGAPDTIMAYRTKDDKVQEVPASTMLAIAGEVLGQKQRIVSNSWKHKDAVRALTDMQDILDYDITTGW